MTPYHFSILRYVHDVATGEFVNVGVVAWSLEDGSIHTRLNERYSRASAFFSGFDGELYRRFIRSTQRSLDELQEDVRQTDLLRPYREMIGDAINLLLREDDSAFQWSDVMGGVTDNLERRVEELFDEIVLKHEQYALRERRDETAIAQRVDKMFSDHGLLNRIKRRVELRSEDYEYSFHAGWSNGVPQVLEPISFDYVRSGDLVEKANTWGGRLFNLARVNEFGFTGVLAAPSDPGLAGVFDKAISILRHAPKVRQLIQEDRLEDFLPQIEQDLRS